MSEGYLRERERERERESLTAGNAWLYATVGCFIFPITDFSNNRMTRNGESVNGVAHGSFSRKMHIPGEAFFFLSSLFQLFFSFYWRTALSAYPFFFVSCYLHRKTR